MNPPAHLVFSDEWLVAINKPAHLSLATSRRDPCGAVNRLLARLAPAEKEIHPLEASDLWLVHRLDVGTTGLVLLARDPETHRALVSAFSSRKVAKTYLALVWGHPRPWQGRWDLPLGPDPQDRRRMKVDPEGRRAVTRYQVLAAPPYVSLVQLEPETGRTHQLRVHLAHHGHPVVGDDLYGGPRHHGVRDSETRHRLNPGHTFLHAWRLHLIHPVLSSELILEAPLPPDFQVACPFSLPA